MGPRFSCRGQYIAYMKYCDYNLQLLRVLNCRSILRSVKKEVQLHFSCTGVSSYIYRSRGVKCNFTKQPVDQHRLINLYNLHVCMCVCVCVRACVRAHTHTHTHTHTHITEVNLSVFVYKLFHDFSPTLETNYR